MINENKTLLKPISNNIVKDNLDVSTKFAGVYKSHTTMIVKEQSHKSERKTDGQF